MSVHLSGQCRGLCVIDVQIKYSWRSARGTSVGSLATDNRAQWHGATARMLLERTRVSAERSTSLGLSQPQCTLRSWCTAVCTWKNLIICGSATDSCGIRCGSSSSLGSTVLQPGCASQSARRRPAGPLRAAGRAAGRTRCMRPGAARTSVDRGHCSRHERARRGALVIVAALTPNRLGASS